MRIHPSISAGSHGLCGAAPPSGFPACGAGGGGGGGGHPQPGGRNVVVDHEGRVLDDHGPEGDCCCMGFERGGRLLGVQPLEVRSGRGRSRHVGPGGRKDDRGRSSDSCRRRPRCGRLGGGRGEGQGGGCQEIVVDARSEAQERGEAGVAEQAVHDHVVCRHETILGDLPLQGGEEHHLGLVDHLVRRGGVVRHRRGEGHLEEVVGRTILLDEDKIDLGQGLLVGLYPLGGEEALVVRGSHLEDGAVASAVPAGQCAGALANTYEEAAEESMLALAC